MRFNGTFPQRANEKSDAAWASLFPKKLGFVQHPELAPNVAGIAVFHELHCLVSHNPHYDISSLGLTKARISSDRHFGPQWMENFRRWAQKSRKWTIEPAIIIFATALSICDSRSFASLTPTLRRWTTPHEGCLGGKQSGRVGTLNSILWRITSRELSCRKKTLTS